MLEYLGKLSTEMISHFFISFANSARITIHIDMIRGINNHHIAEATFKSLARSLKAALSNDPRQEGAIASTKGTISQ